jgi:hypothetical protein
MERKAGRKGMLNTSATREPIHAPVPGTGNATRRYKPKSFNLDTETPFFLAVLYSNSKMDLVILHLDVRMDTGLKSMSRKGTGKMFPHIAKIRVFQKGSS